MKRSLTISLLTIGYAASFAGAISGTLAWYAYSARTKVSYAGTSVANSEQLQIGIRLDKTAFLSESGVFDVERYNKMKEELVTNVNNGVKTGVSIEEVNGNDYAFNKPGSGLDSYLLSTYLSYEGYATNELTPVTTNSFKHREEDEVISPDDPEVNYAYDLTNKNTETNSEHPLSLYQQPKIDYPTIDKLADKRMYATIPFVFRVIRINSDKTEYAPGQSIWLSDCRPEAYSEDDGDIYRSIRIYSDGVVQSKTGDNVSSRHERFLLNPSITKDNDDGKHYTYVAGALDLNGDGYFDTDNTYSYQSGRERIYGDYKLKKGYTLDSASADPLKQDSGYTDLNQTGSNDPSSFTAKHRAGYRFYENYDAFELGKAYYETMGEIAPRDDGTGSLSGGKVLCTTDYETNIAEVSFTIYLEGFDHSVIDKEIHHAFNLGLQFKINRVL